MLTGRLGGPIAVGARRAVGKFTRVSSEAPDESSSIFEALAVPSAPAEVVVSGMDDGARTNRRYRMVELKMRASCRIKNQPVASAVWGLIRIAAVVYYIVQLMHRP